MIIKIKKYFLEIFLIIIISYLTNFPYNFYNILKNNYYDRMIFNYGYCQPQGYGFIKYVKEKYKIKNNLVILNKKTQPSSEWFFFKTNVAVDKNYFIFLNFNNLDEISNIIKKKFKIIEKKDNCILIKI